MAVPLLQVLRTHTSILAGRWQRRGPLVRPMLLAGLGVLALTAAAVTLTRLVGTTRIEAKLQARSEDELHSLRALVVSVMERRLTDATDVATGVLNEVIARRNLDYPGQIWTVWSPQVTRYMAVTEPQRTVKAPRDAVDEAALRGGVPVGRFVDDAWRFSLPIVLGVTVGAEQAACHVCHQGRMGLRDGEVIAVFSSRLTAAQEFATLRRQLWEVAGAGLLGTGIVVTLVGAFVAQRKHRKAAEAALLESETFARSILDSSPDCINVLDLEGRLLFMSDPGLHAMEIEDFARVSGHAWYEQWPAAGAATAKKAVNEATAGGTARFTAFRPTRTGTPKWWDVCVNSIPGADGKPMRLLVVSHDVTEAKRAQDEIERARVETREAAERCSAVLESTTDAVILLDRDGRMTYVNQRAAVMLAGKALKLGAYLSDCFLPEDWGSFDLHFGLAMTERMPVAFEEHLDSLGLWLNVHAYPTAEGALSIFFRDITEQRAAEREQMIAQERITHMAHHDALTGLPNRAQFREKLEQAVLQTRRGGLLALHFLDLDRFKVVNDTLGHPIGDRLLQAVTERLLDGVRETDTVARLGGDEFAILQIPLELPKDAIGLAGRLVGLLEEPFEVDGHIINVGASIGMAFAPQDGQDAEHLMKCADLALYRAKADGRGVYRLFHPEMNAAMQTRCVMEAELRQALQAGQFELFFQPLIETQTRKISGYEALIRWRHPTRGLVSPDQFIPVSEETGLIVPIGEWVLRHACAVAAGWPGEQKVAVNLSPVQFKSPNLLAAVVASLRETGLDPTRLELEITETVLLLNTDTTLATLHQLRGLGIKIAMDDFGTGYSSLAYLRRFPFDRIKIDQSFVRDLGKRSDSMAIVLAVTALGRELGIAVIAEGVETPQQFAMLEQAGCTEMQGFLFSAAVPADMVNHAAREMFVKQDVLPHHAA